jgi:hypothetical protein
MVENWIWNSIIDFFSDHRNLFWRMFWILMMIFAVITVAILCLIIQLIIEPFIVKVKMVVLVLSAVSACLCLWITQNFMHKIFQNSFTSKGGRIHETVSHTCLSSSAEYELALILKELRVITDTVCICYKAIVSYFYSSCGWFVLFLICCCSCAKKTRQVKSQKTGNLLQWLSTVCALSYSPCSL